MGGSEKSRFVPLLAVARERLLGARVLGDGLGALADGVLGQLAGKRGHQGRHQVHELQVDARVRHASNGTNRLFSEPPTS